MAVSTDIKEKFDKLNQIFSFLDTTDWTDSQYDNPSGGNIDTTVPLKVICQINVNDATTNHYQNSGWATNSFSNEDLTIDISSTPTNVVTINNTIGLPYNSNLDVVQGEYTISYKIQATDQAATTYILETENEYNYLFDNPSVKLDIDVNCSRGTFTVEDNTQTTVDNVSPTTTAREIKVTYPTDANQAPTTTSNPNLVLTSFYTNTQQVDLTLTLNYEFDDYDVQVKLEAHKDVPVSCDSNLCDLYCCLKSLYDRMSYAYCKSRVDYTRLEEKYKRANYLASLIRNAESCAKDTDINAMVTELKQLTNCNGDCSCGGGKSKSITGSGGTSIVSPFPSLLQYASAGDSSRVVSALIGKTLADFIVYDGDGNVIPPSNFDPITGEITFAYTITSGLKYFVHIFN